jgi:16S rRNA (guanine1207-N2)-methyltransferase
MDFCFDCLLPYLSDTNKTTLLIVDENALENALISDHNNLTVVTNRFDVFLQFKQQSVDCYFSDFDFNGFVSSSYDQILYRVSKEKPIVHYIINQSSHLLKNNGYLVLTGQKNDGIKTYCQKASRLFGVKTITKKTGKYYTCAVTKKTVSDDLLCDKNYTEIRQVFTLNQSAIHSKPGVFGWNKPDQGSQLLIEAAQKWIEKQTCKPLSLLDLGCGYGLLTMASLAWQSILERTATDNNAAALTCIEYNAKQHDADINVVAADCAIGIDACYDLILCNPPFHQGFDVDSNLTKKFINQAYSHLKKDGSALFVVNQFINIQKYAEPLFSEIIELTSDKQFKVFKFSR